MSLVGKVVVTPFYASPDISMAKSRCFVALLVWMVAQTMVQVVSM